MNNNTSILYVDDEPINLSLFKINFGKKYNVKTAESGCEGLQNLKSNSDIQIVISDMKMPGMNGIEFIKLAKQNFPNILFFILTGFEITDEIADALNNKLILKYFRKPLDLKEIEGSIKEVI
jgi:two-component system, response regulator, stage 0 sporulation protein F